jgi:hypothetical protein
MVAVLSMPIATTAARAEEPRRISVSLQPSLYIFDSNYFDLDPGLGMDASLRYEIATNIFFENNLGIFRTSGSGVTVDGLDERLGAMAIFPVLISYRPIARLGLGFLSTNPITVTPTQTFRPTQTTFYLIGGAGLSRSVFTRFLVEADMSFWATPYKYRIYRFDRLNVSTESERFMHLEIQLGVSYTF